MRDRQGEDAVDQAQCPCSASPFPSSALSVKLLAAAIRSSPLRPDVTTTWSPLWGPRTMGVALKPCSVRTNTVGRPLIVWIAPCGTRIEQIGRASGRERGGQYG